MCMCVRAVYVDEIANDLVMQMERDGFRFAEIVHFYFV